MEHIGAYLTNGRTAKGLSREDISRITKIPLKFVVALEEEDFETLPEAVYIRGFVRTYCEEVGLSPDPVLGRLSQALPKEGPVHHTDNPGISLGGTPIRLSGGKASPRSRMGIALVLLFVVLGLLFGILTLTQGPSKTDMSQVGRPSSSVHTTYPSVIDQNVSEPGRYYF